MQCQRFYPFTAIVGQAAVKQALLIALVNPAAGGVLIAGAAGTAKTSLVRSLNAIAGCRLLELPLSATEDMVFGAIDIEQALTRGETAFSPGLLARAHQQILYIDEINLLRRDLLAAVLEVAGRGLNIVEREGISHRHPAEFTLIGTLNPAEGTLPPATLDRFGLFVTVDTDFDAADRAEILRRVLAFERDSSRFIASCREAGQELAAMLQAAKTLLPAVEVSAAMLELAAQYAAKANTAGHRAEIFLLEAAKAIAALADRSWLLPVDMEQAAAFVLPHRLRETTPPPQQPKAEPPSAPDAEPQQEETGDQSPEAAPAGADAESGQSPPPDGADAGAQQQAQDRTEAIDQQFSQAKLAVSLPQDRHVRQGSGKRSLTRTSLRQGRYVRAALPNGDVSDLAFDATLRAAAPYQRSRAKHGCAVAIRPQDLRQKIREKRIGTIFLFAVDASGSMGAQQRMRAVKGAIFAILQDAYQKRDQVGMIAFRRQSAEVILPVTRSVDLAQKCLANLPTGGKTPLAAGLEAALTQLETLKKKDRQLRPVLVVVTDGRANSSAAGGDAVGEAVSVAEKIGRSGFSSVVIDTESDFISLAVARKLSLLMGSTYYHIKDLSRDCIIQIVKNLAP
ncbi:MAG: VWA domain-containing protein [Sporomusaceae bacterium]|nr:VWA domain-containing protein [Sporomusaceae bacterium]